MKTRLGVTVVLLTISFTGLNAESFDQLMEGVPGEVAITLLEEGEVYRLDRNEDGIRILPNCSMASHIIQLKQQLQPDVFTEGLFLLPYPEGKDEIDLDVYNLTRQVSNISDVVYKSHRKKAFVPLFDEVYAVDDMGSKEPVPDPIVTEIRERDTIVMHMKEVNLGRALYQTDYLWDGYNLGFFMVNLGNLRKVIKVVGKENMQINIVLMPTEHGYLLYGSCGVKLSNESTVYSMMDPYTGFYRRLYALVTWIYNTMHGTDRLPDFGTPLEF